MIALPAHSRSPSEVTINVIKSAISRRIFGLIAAGLLLIISAASYSYPNLPSLSRAVVSSPVETGICQRTLLYRFAGSHGFASEYLIFLRVALLAKQYKYALFIDDSNWNYGNYTDYFESPVNDCVPTEEVYTRKRSNVAPHARDSDTFSLQQAPFWTKSDHVQWSSRKLEYLDKVLLALFVDGEKLEELHTKDIMQWPVKKPLEREATLPEVFEPVHQRLSNQLKQLWRLNADMQSAISAVEDQIRKDAGPDRAIISAHIRLGDKFGELANYGPHVFSKPSNPLSALYQAWKKHYTHAKALLRLTKSKDPLAPSASTRQGLDADSYLQAASSIASSLPPSTIKPILMIMSDAPPASLSSLSLHPLASQFDIHLGLPSPSTLQERSQAGFKESSFNSLSASERTEAAKTFIKEMHIFAGIGKGLVMSGSSNVGRLMALLAGIRDDEVDVRSTDVRWFPTVRYQ